MLATASAAIALVVATATEQNDNQKNNPQATIVAEVGEAVHLGHLPSVLQSCLKFGELRPSLRWGMTIVYTS